MGFKAHVVTEDSASGAQIIDGSLKVDDGSSNDLHKLTRTGTSGNRRTYTWAGWVKRQQLADKQTFMFAESDDSNQTSFGFNHSGATPASGFYFRTEISGTVVNATIDASLRDTTNFYHIVVAVDTTRSYQDERIRVYINGKLQTWITSPGMGEDNETFINHNVQQQLFAQDGGPDLETYISNLYFLDGLALGPGYFGFTDPLTNTWRPKKFREEGTTVNDGTDWSSTIGDFTNGANVFNGNVTNQGYANNTGVTTLTTGKFILKNNLRMLHNFREDGTYNLLINGVSINVPGNGTDSTTYRWADVDLSSLQLPITVTSLKYYISQVSGNSIRAIEVDGVIMQDSTTTNIDFGTNGFYLPFDGNSPIGEDKSGKGNDWTPVKFGGSAALDKATGALPIMNTVSGGNYATVGVRTDAYANDLVLALPLVGNANDVSNQINSGSTTKTVTVDGATATSTVSNFYGGSFDFDGSNDDLTWSITGGLGSGDFTIEYWVYQDTLSDYQTHFSSTRGSTGFNVGTDASGDFVWYSNSARQIEVVGAITTGRWYHWAFVRSGSTITGYLDGVEQASFSSSVDYSASAFSLGALDGNGEHTNGKFSDARIYVGTAKYTSNFIPASTNPDILPDTPSGVSGGSKPTKITEGAVSFPNTGSGDDLTLADSDDFYFGGGQFSIETFIYKQDTGTFQHWFRQRDSGSDEQAFVFDIDSSGGSDVFKRGYVQLEWASDKEFEGTNANIVNDRWHHLLMTKDSGGTGRIFVDGVLKGSQALGDPGNQNSTFYIGNYSANNSYEYEGFMSNMRLVKGSIPTDYQTSSTTNGTQVFNPPTSPLTTTSQGATANDVKLLCLQSNTSATTAAVTPGTITANGDVVATNFNPFNTDINTVRGQESGYPTLDPNNKLSNAVLSNNNLSWTCDNTGAGTVLANVAVDAGKYYWEVTVDNGNRFHAGVHVGAGDTLTIYDAGAILDNNWAFRTDGAKVHDDSESSTNFSNVSAIGNVIQLAYDADGGNLWFGANGHWFEGDPSTLSGPSYTGVTHAAGISPMINRRTNDNGASINFGQKPFKYVPPIGFSPINASSIRSATRPISNPKAYFNSLTYNAAGGQGGSRHIDAGLEADFIWIKNRNSVKWHILVNGVIGYDKFMSSNSDMALSTEAHVTNVHKTGYTVNDIDSGTVNEPGLTYVAWNWKAGGHSNNYNIDGVGHATAAAAGLSCTADLQGASIGTKQGFSIIQYQATSGETVAHGLSQQPDFMMIKNYDTQNDWMIYHKYGNGSGGDMSSSQGMNLNNTDGTFTSGSNTFITAKSATTFTVGSSAIVQNGSDDFCAFVWHDVPGLQKFGYYKGTGSSDGPVIKLGFRPALLIVKRTDADGEPWTMYDNVRGGDFKNPNTYNANAKGLYANDNAAENDASGRYKDFTNDGFKVRGTSGEQNSTGGFYIYMAWAEAPAFNLYGASAPSR